MKLCVLVLKWEKALGLVIEVPISAWPFQGFMHSKSDVSEAPTLDAVGLHMSAPLIATKS